MKRSKGTQGPGDSAGKKKFSVKMIDRARRRRPPFYRRLSLRIRTGYDGPGQLVDDDAAAIRHQLAGTLHKDAEYVTDERGRKQLVTGIVRACTLVVEAETPADAIAEYCRWNCNLRAGPLEDGRDRFEVRELEADGTPAAAADEPLVTA